MSAPWVTPETETLDIAALQAENAQLKARIELMDSWPSTALSAAMQILEAPQVYSALWKSQQNAVDRIRAGWNELAKQAGVPVTVRGH